MHVNDSFHQLVPQSLQKALFVIAYILLIAPPQAIEIKARADKNQGELYGRSLLFVLFSETALRAGVFLLIGYSSERIIGNELYEKYRLDYFFFWLLVAGIIHIASYYVTKGLYINKNRERALFLYRLGRNITYAVVPALISALLILFFQARDQIELFSGILVQSVFFTTFLIFIFVGIQEALVRHLVINQRPSARKATSNRK